MRLAKIQITLRNPTVWSEYLLGAMQSFFLRITKTDRTTRMRKLI